MRCCTSSFKCGNMPSASLLSHYMPFFASRSIKNLFLSLIQENLDITRSFEGCLSLQPDGFWYSIPGLQESIDTRWYQIYQYNAHCQRQCLTAYWRWWMQSTAYSVHLCMQRSSFRGGLVTFRGERVLQHIIKIIINWCKRRGGTRLWRINVFCIIGGSYLTKIEIGSRFSC